jgi:hypothetical protein
MPTLFVRRYPGVAELKDSVLALAPEERHEFVAWVNRLGADYGDLFGTC